MRPRTWSAGRCLVFDDSWEHEVWNDSAAPRSVLLLDVSHPDLARPAEHPRPQPPANDRKSERQGWVRADDLDVPLQALGRNAAGLFRSVFALLGPEHTASMRRSLAGLCGARSHLVAAAATCAVHSDLASSDFDAAWARVPAGTGALRKPWGALLAALEGSEMRTLPAPQQIDVVQACMTYWRSLPGNAAAARGVLDRWPASQMRDLVRRLASQPTVLRMCEFLAAYEAQSGAPPFGATAPLFVSAYRQVAGANRQGPP